MARLSPLGLFAKWVVAPTALLAAGFYLVGPQVGGWLHGGTVTASKGPIPGPREDADAESSGGAQASPAPEQPVDENPRRFPEPQVEVTARRVDISEAPDADADAQAEQRAAERREKRAAARREARQKAEAERARAEQETKSVQAPPDDGGGSGGAVGEPPPADDRSDPPPPPDDGQGES